MKNFCMIAIAAAAVIATGSASMAAPCAVGTTTNAQGQNAATDKTSKADGTSDAKVTPGAKAESPGTVGAMSNVGGNTQPGSGEKKPAEGQVVKQGSNDC